MTTRTLVRIALKSITKNMMRTLLTILGVVIGVAAVIVMVGVGYGASRSIQTQVNGLGTNMIMLTAGASSAAGVSQGAQTLNRLSVADYDKLAREATLLSDVSPFIVARAQVIGGNGNWRTALNGVATSYPVIRDWATTTGSFFTESDVAGLRKVAVLGATVARNLFPDSDPVGQQVQLRNVPFTIAGVLAAKGQNAAGSDQDDIVMVPYTTMQTRLAGNNFIVAILSSTRSPDDIAEAQEEIRTIMRESHRIALGEADDFTVRNQTELAKAAQGTTQVMSWLLAAVASISLLVGGIGIMNIMLVSVTERTHEIGLRLAIGARGSDVMKQFLVEAVVLSALGGLIGAAIGFGGSALVGKLTGWSTAVPALAFPVAIGFAGAVGVFFGFYPARRASALNPIEALRHE